MDSDVNSDYITEELLPTPDRAILTAEGEHFQAIWGALQVCKESNNRKMKAIQSRDGTIAEQSAKIEELTKGLKARQDEIDRMLETPPEYKQKLQAQIANGREAVERIERRDASIRKRDKIIDEQRKALTQKDEQIEKMAT